MFADKFKTSKKSDISKAIKVYVSKHYDMNAFTKIESLCNEIDFSRNAAIEVANMEKGMDTMKKAKQIIIDYLKLLNSVRTRLSFGNDDSSVKVSFSWYDVLKKDNYSSYSFAHEYYNMLFNLAICLVTMGKSISIKDEEDVLKQAIKNFNQAAWI